MSYSEVEVLCDDMPNCMNRRRHFFCCIKKIPCCRHMDPLGVNVKLAKLYQLETCIDFLGYQPRKVRQVFFF